MRDLGAMGEDTFSFLCNSVGLIANGSKIDKTGWDFFVEFPENIKKETLADMKPAPLECRIQVKSTDKKDRKVQINLKNMNRLVKAPMPSFICLIKFNKKNDPQTIYLTHIDKNLIERTLKRLRELSEKNVSNFNKRKLTVNFSEEDKVKSVSGEALKAAIEKHISKGLSRYIKEKEKIIQEVGFESGWAQINFNVADENPVEKMVDLTLGLVEDVKISNLIGRHSRFGILSQKPFVENKSGRIQLPNLKPDKSCTVKFKDSKYGPGHSFKAKLYSSPLNKLLPEENVKFRIEWNLFNLVVKPYTGETNFQYSFSDNAKETSIKELYQFLKLMDSFSRNKYQTWYIEISISDEMPPLTASFNVKDFPKIDVPIDIVSKACNIAQHFQIENKIYVNLYDILKYSQSISAFYDVVLDNNSIKFSFEIDSDEINLSKEIGVISFMKTKIGKYLIGCVLGAVGTARRIEKRYEVDNPQKKYFKNVVIDEQTTIENEDLLKLAHEIADEMEQVDIIPVILNS